MSCAHIYSALDPTARKINLAKFTHGKCSTLIVTDLAARGLDIPLLDNVINYSFPAKGKLFLHRVGEEPGTGPGPGWELSVQGQRSGERPGGLGKGPPSLWLRDVAQVFPQLGAALEAPFWALSPCPVPGPHDILLSPLLLAVLSRNSAILVPLL